VQLRTWVDSHPLGAYRGAGGPGSLSAMTRAQAERRCADLRRHAAPDDDRHWLARESPAGDWQVVEVRLRGIRRARPLNATVESKPRPAEPPDPRPSLFRSLPPYGL
jgi:hypothetical protein